MTRSIVRIVLTTLAFVMLFAGSLNLNRAAPCRAPSSAPARAVQIPVAPSNWPTAREFGVGWKG